MTLLSFTLPADKLDLINRQISFRSSRLSEAISDQQKAALQAEIAVLQKFSDFVSQADDEQSYSMLSLPVDYSQNPGVGANLDIFLAVSLPGNPEMISDTSLVDSINSFIKESKPGITPEKYEKTQFDNILIAHSVNSDDLVFIRINKSI